MSGYKARSMMVALQIDRNCIADVQDSVEWPRVIPPDIRLFDLDWIKIWSAPLSCSGRNR